jgi:acetyl esterase/lipase
MNTSTLPLRRAIGATTLAATALLVLSYRTPVTAAASPENIKDTQKNSVFDVAYGGHERQRLDLYLPEAPGPHPVVMFIHGGGWSKGDKTSRMDRAILSRVLAAGCAFVSVEYRFLGDAKKAGIYPPVLAPLQDAKSALQFLRLNAPRWNLDPGRVVVYGGSAGAFTSLWLALSPDMAEPGAQDPQARMSTRVRAVGGIGAQTSIDPAQMRAWTGPKMKYGSRAFGITSFEQFLERRDEFAKYYPILSPAALVSADDPPVYLRYDQKLDDASDSNGYHTHSPRFGIAFREVAIQAGVFCALSYPESKEPAPEEDLVDFLIKHARQAIRE